MSFVLVHAPVLGPGSWSPVAGELARHGHRVTVPALTGFADGGPPYVPRLIQRASDQLGHHPATRAVLVVHSGAGVFAPYLAAAAAADVVIFADASLPAQDPAPSTPAPSTPAPSTPAPSALDRSIPDPQGPARVTDAAFLPFLRDIAAGGIVPPWPRWWSAEDLAPLYPDDATRDAVNAEAAPLPLAFYEEILPPIPASWPARHRGYLQFSEGYAETARQARVLGWPVRELPGEHLHMLVDPVGVAAAITGLALGLPGTVQGASRT
jgi:hypothetical protein